MPFSAIYVIISVHKSILSRTEERGNKFTQSLKILMQDFYQLKFETEILKLN